MDTFREGYLVRYSEKMPSGFYSYGREEVIYIDVEPGKEKGSHREAHKKFMAEHPTATIVSISYI